MIQAGNLVIQLPTAIVTYAWVLAQLGEASHAMTRLREGEQLLDRQVAREMVVILGSSTMRWVGPLSC